MCKSNEKLPFFYGEKCIYGTRLAIVVGIVPSNRRFRTIRFLYTNETTIVPVEYLTKASF